MADRAYGQIAVPRDPAMPWPLLAEVLDPARYPVAGRVGAAAGAEYGAAHDPARSFRFGLQRIIDGIAIFVGQASR
jgi:hypothetical protein